MNAVAQAGRRVVKRFLEIAGGFLVAGRARVGVVRRPGYQALVGKFLIRSCGIPLVTGRTAFLQMDVF